MAPTVEECITLPNGMKMPRLALGTWKVFMILLSTKYIITFILIQDWEFVISSSEPVTVPEFQSFII